MCHPCHLLRSAPAPCRPSTFFLRKIFLSYTVSPAAKCCLKLDCASSSAKDDVVLSSSWLHVEAWASFAAWSLILFGKYKYTLVSKCEASLGFDKTNKNVEDLLHSRPRGQHVIRRAKHESTFPLCMCGARAQSARGLLVPCRHLYFPAV